MAVSFQRVRNVGSSLFIKPFLEKIKDGRRTSDRRESRASALFFFRAGGSLKETGNGSRASAMTVDLGYFLC